MWVYTLCCNCCQKEGYTIIQHAGRPLLKFFTFQRLYRYRSYPPGNLPPNLQQPGKTCFLSLPQTRSQFSLLQIITDGLFNTFTPESAYRHYIIVPSQSARSGLPSHIKCGHSNLSSGTFRTIHLQMAALCMKMSVKLYFLLSFQNLWSSFSSKRVNNASATRTISRQVLSRDKERDVLTKLTAIHHNPQHLSDSGFFLTAPLTMWGHVMGRHTQKHTMLGWLKPHLPCLKWKTKQPN